MPVLLRHSRDLPTPSKYDAWLSVTGTPPFANNANNKLPGLAARLEQAFEAERETWWTLGRALGGEPGAEFAQMPTAGTFGCDFGVMLAWCRITGELAKGASQETSKTLVLCDDPWLFRQLATLPGVDAGKTPSLLPVTLRLAFRGWLARAKVAAKMAAATLLLRSTRRVMVADDAVILVYGHPASDANGKDAYFGDLMKKFPGLKRLLHTDCGTQQARQLGADNRTASLHAWGNPLFALSLIFSFWHPAGKHLSGATGWLVRRAQAMENSGGGVAMNRWQAHCQGRWMEAAKPGRVLWPWENHGWERNLCRAGRAKKIPMTGYQHTVIGPHQFNYATATNPDGLASIPDIVVADGPAYRAEMIAWGVPEKTIVLGGAFRFPRFSGRLYDPTGPVFVPLSAVAAAAALQLEVAEKIAANGRTVVVKPHPMYPYDFLEKANLHRSDTSLADQGGLSAVLYSTGASGLEARLMGVPAYRLMLEDRIAIDVLPAGYGAFAVTRESAAESVIGGAAKPERITWDDILSDPDWEVWKTLLSGDIDTALGNAAPSSNETKQES
ncbi:MAG: hypothetical protein HQ513_17760 [Rhodospirillales bacterium]|nr:hypothetical protein [Rhodospirillales bacterium]